MDPTSFRTMTIAELLDAHPGAGAAFTERGMACVGCAMARFETVEEVAAAYDAKLDLLLADLARRAAAPYAGPHPVRRRSDRANRKDTR